MDVFNKRTACLNSFFNCFAPDRVYACGKRKRLDRRVTPELGRVSRFLAPCGDWRTCFVPVCALLVGVCDLQNARFIQRFA